MGSKLIIMSTSMNCFLPPIEDLSTCRVIWGKRRIVQKIIIFVGEHNYERPQTNDDILDIEGWRPIKQIMTKRLNWNIITTLCGIDTLEAKEGHNDDDDNDTNIPDDQSIMTTMSFDPSIKILPLIILSHHESQGLHNHRHLAFCNCYA
jgi:hypothetical protein